MDRWSIITPCSRVYNLPIICKSIINQDTNVEWIIVYDGKIIPEIDDRISMYINDKIKLKLLISNDNEPSTGNAWKLRNIGIDNATGDYLYFLDDDNVLHRKFFSSIKNVKTKLAVLNQIGRSGEVRFKEGITLSVIKNSLIDTAQLYVRNGLGVYWGSSNRYNEESVYLNNILSVIDNDNDITYIQQPACYYNRIRWE